MESFDFLRGPFLGQPEVGRCETCSRQMQILEFSGRGSVILSRDEFTFGIGVAEQCWECGRVYCNQCYPIRPPNTCVCGRGRDAIRYIDGTIYRGSLRLVKVRYLSYQKEMKTMKKEVKTIKIFVPQLNRSYDLPDKTLNPYTTAEMAKALPKLKEKSLFIDFQKDIDGPQTATRLIRKTLSEFGVSWVQRTQQAEAVIWIQEGSGSMRLAFIVAHPEDKEKFITAECGPGELTATIMTGICEYFGLMTGEVPRGELAELLAHVNDLNRAITGAVLAQNWTKTRHLMDELRVAVEKLGFLGGAEAVKPVVDALADSAGAYEITGFVEAKALREAAIETLQRIGKESIPWIKEGLTHSHPAVRKACKRALKACGVKPWWQFW